MVVVAVALLVVAPQPDSVRVGAGGFPVSWLWSWLEVPGVWAGPPMPPTPKQASGTAAGKDHYVSSAATRAGKGSGGPRGKGVGELDPYQPHRQSVTPVTTGPARHGDGFNPATSKRVASAASATSDVYANADGSYTRKVFAEPVNYRTPDGSWQPIDTTLGRARLGAGADGRWHETANSVGVDVAGGGDDPTLVSVRPNAGSHAGSDAGQVLGYGLQGARPVTPTVAGSTATYPVVLPSTDVVLSSTATGVAQSLVLRSADAATSWLLPLRLTGLTARNTGGGGVEFVDAAGSVTATLLPGLMSDGRIDPASGNRAESTAVSFQMTSVGGVPAVRMSVDAGWVHDRARVFPVTVTSTVAVSAVGGSGSDGAMAAESGAAVMQHGLGGSGAVLPELRAGTFNGGQDVAQSLLTFGNFASTFAGLSMAEARLNLFDIWASSCATPLPSVAVDAVTAPSTAPGAGPGTKPGTPPRGASGGASGPGPVIGARLGSLAAFPGAACTNMSLDPDTGAWLAVPLDAAAVKARGTTGTAVVAVTASATDSRGWKKFASVNSSHPPYLSLTFAANALPQIVSQYPPDNASVATLTPELLGVGTDPDGGPSPLRYVASVFDSATGNLIKNSGLIGAGDWVVPAGTLGWSKSYLWTVQAFDGAAYSTPTFRMLSTPPPQPLITSALSQNSGRGYNTAIGNYTTSATDAQVATVGPELSIERDYNSRDFRVGSAFGAGWSSVVDARVAQQYDPTSGAVTTVTVTYPSGQQVAFGRNTDGSFTPPPGRFATFASASLPGGGYTLTDKNATVYTFTQLTGIAGVWAISSIRDAAGRTETFSYPPGQTVQVSAITAASGRALHLTWSTPSGASTAHVATVATDPATPGDATTVSTWTYSYTGDQLMKVCPPTSATACTSYGYQPGSLYPTVVLNAAPRTYLRLGDAPGSTTATSSVLANEGNDNATYTNVTLGQPGPLPASTATAATFNGTSSYVDLTAGAQSKALVNTSSYQSVSLWFKTTTPNGVLFSYQSDPISNPTTTGNYVPALYVGADGKLLGELWNGSVGPIVTNGPVTDGAWHHVVLSGGGAGQSMYLDGTLVGSQNGPVVAVPSTATNQYVGAGFIGGWWPDEVHAAPGNPTAYSQYFTGSISDVALYNRPLPAATIGQIYTAGHTPAPQLTTITRPLGNPSAQVAYDGATGTVAQVTDANGGVWKLGPPTVSGSSQVYASSVLAAAPVDYWRLGDSSGTNATNEINRDNATYNTVTLGTPGPFADATAATFNGTSSSLNLSFKSVHLHWPDTDNRSVSLWFKTSTGNGVLLSFTPDDPVALPTTPRFYLPALYVGTDGKLLGEFFTDGGQTSPISTAASVADGKWHHAVLSAGATSQSLYLDGTLVGTKTGTIETSPGYTYVGTGYLGGPWPDQPHFSTVSYTGYTTPFTGSISDVAVYNSQLSAQQVSQQWAAYHSSSGVAPTTTVAVTDPGGKQITERYDALNGNRLIAHTDGHTDRPGNTTRYGYDTSGFLNTVTDANGNVTTTGHDVRGNLVSQTTCQNQKDDSQTTAASCSTTYYTYYPDDTSATLTPDPRNDLVLTVRDGRSTSASDGTYLTSYGYDPSGNRTGVTTPPVAGFPAGRTTTTTYTTADTPAADGGTTPPGLPASVTTPGGAVARITYYRTGDVAQSTDAAGLVTKYRYDGLGLVATKTEVSDSYPTGLATSYTYDKLSRTATQTAPPVTNRVTGAVHTARTSTGYDDDGHVTSVKVEDTTGGDASRTTTTSYNNRGQAETVTDAAGAVTTYGYDLYGNKASETDPSGQRVEYAYDADGRLLTTTLKKFVGDPANPSPPKDLVTSSYAYDPAGRLATVTDAMGRTTSYTYLDNGLVFEVKRTDPISGASFIVQDDYYDAAGNLSDRVTNNRATDTYYAVDAAGRTWGTNLDFGGLGRITKYAYSPDDTVLTTTVKDASGTATVVDSSYDPLGRMTSRSVHNDGAGKPAGWWRLNETAGTAAADSSGAGQTGFLGAGVTWSGGAAKFTGSGGPIATAGPVLNTAQSYTVSAWVNLASTAGFSTAVSQGGASTAAFYLQYSPSYGGWTFIAPNADNATAFASVHTSTAALNTWTHLVAVFDSATGAMRLYVNGTLAVTGANTSPWNATGPLGIGGVKHTGGATDNIFNGSVDNVQVYTRALAAGDVSTLYGAGRTGTALAASTLTTTWTLDQRGLPTAMIDPNGNTTGYTFDEAGHRAMTVAPTVTTETGGGAPIATHPVTTVGYDTFGEQTETSDPNGNSSTSGYDAAGRPTSVTLPAYTPPGATTPVTAVSKRDYNNLGQLKTATDPVGNQTTYTYDQLGNIATVTAPNGGLTHNTYDTNGEQLSATDPTGGQTQATYDYLGRKATATQLVRQPAPAAYTTIFTYDDTMNSGGGWLSKVTTPAGVVTTFTHNKAGEATTVADVLGNTTRYTFDAAGRTTRVTAPDGSYHTTGYDGAGRATTQSAYDATNTLQATRSARYDDDGNVTAATDARGHTTTFGYNATNWLTGETQPVTDTKSITTSYGYDPAGNRTRYTDGRGNPFITTYNAWNLPEQRVEPATPAYPNLADRRTSLGYDADGRLTSQTLPGGVATTLGYDKLSNVNDQTGTGADAPTAERTFTYDLAGRLKTATTPAGTNTFSYDDRNLLLTATGPSGNSSFAYTPDGAMATRTDAAGTTSYSYDTAGRLFTVANPTTGVDLSINYNSLSQPNRIAYGPAGNTRTIGYDALHRLASDTLKTPTVATVASITYGYDPNGNESSKITAGFAGASANTYTYDYADRLASWTNTIGTGQNTVSYGYDDSGNRTQVGTKTFSYDARDRITAGGGSTYTYTARGTLASTVTGSATVTSRYDAYGQAVNQGSAAYSYDALGRVVRSGFSYSGTGNLLAADGAASYTRDPGGGLLAVKTPSSSALAWTDRHTDVVGQFTATGTALTGSASYDPLGKTTASSGLLGSLGYQSGWTDTGTGRVNMAARWYNPDTGQFDSHDSATLNPTPNPADANPFAYAGENPLTGTDPTGHRVCVDECGGAADMYLLHQQVAARSRPTVSTPDHCSAGWYQPGCRNPISSRINPHTGQPVLPPHVSVGPTPAQHATCPHNPNGSQNYYQNCTQVASYADGNVSIDGVTFSKDALKNIDYRDVAAAIDSFKANPITDQGDAATFTAANLDDAVQSAAQHEADLQARADKLACKANFWCSNPVGQVASGAFKAWYELDVGTSGAIWNTIKGDATDTYHDISDAIHGKKSWSDAGLDIYDHIAKANVQMALGIVTLPWQAMKEEVAWEDALIHGDLKGATYHGIKDGYDTAMVLSFFAGGEAGAARGATRATEAGEAEDAASTLARNCHSFDPATPVLMANGTLRQIKDVKLGDKVAATDPLTGRTAAQRVTALHDNHDTDLTDLTVTTAPARTTAGPVAAGPATAGLAAAPGAVTTVLHTTTHHPLWDATTATWTNAANITAGHQLRTLDGHIATVTHVYNHTGTHEMRDLTVASTHTYYVIAGNTPVLVHNCGSDVGLTDVGEAYVKKNHMPGGAGVDETKGIFNPDEDLYKLAEGAGKVKPTRQDNGNCAYVCEADHPVGTVAQTEGGALTNVYTVITDEWGTVVTMHPGVPR